MVTFGYESAVTLGKTLFSQSIEGAKRNPVLSGAGVLAATYALGSLTRPLSLIPSRDDHYNTIEGLDHRGMAGELRRMNTEFGSGWKGIGKTITEIIEKTPVGRATQALEGSAVEKAFQKQMGLMEQQASAALRAENEAELANWPRYKEQILAKRSVDPVRPPLPGRIQSNVKANTIEGLHPKRKVSLKAGTIIDFDDFGSGWRGIIRAGMENFMGAAGETRALQDVVETGTDLTSAFRLSPFTHNIVINPESIAQQAPLMGLTKKELLQGTIKHERYHQEVIEHGLREELKNLSPDIVPREFINWASNLGYIQQEALGSASLIEEYFAWAHTASKFKKSTEFTRMFEPAWQRLGIKAKSAGMRKAEMASAQKATAVHNSVNGQFGGQGHTRYNNKSGG